MSAEEKEFLESNQHFQAMPSHIRGWILASPNATSDFAGFFEKGGTIQTDPDQTKPLYRPSSPPAIVVNEGEWKAMGQHGTNPWPQRHMFGMLAHEIGHDKDNTTRPFPISGSRDEYVQYRSEIEASAIFNAFPIFQDLKGTPEFSKQAPFDSIGYLHGFELAKLYQQWDAGESDEKQTVDAIASKVASTRYTLQGALNDQDGDGVLTHRDAYLRDYERVLRPKNDNTPGVQSSEPKDDARKSGPRVRNESVDGSSDSGHPYPARTDRSLGLNALNAADEAYLAGVREKTARAFAQNGTPLGSAELESVSTCLAAQAKQAGLDHVDHVVLSRHGDGEIARNVFAVEGKLDDPASRRTHVATAQAMSSSPEEALKRLEAIRLGGNQSNIVAEAMTQAPGERGAARQI